ncbi:MAG TPA: MmgE/PrpD family protein [Dehalococcoidales bacterium]
MYSNYSPDITGELSSYISRSGDTELPDEVITKAKHHILDTLSSIVYGSRLKPGQIAKKFAENQKGIEEAQVIGTPIITSAIHAAMVNGIMAHADETDDFDPRYRIHPGASIVPAALAISEREAADGMSFLKGVVVGYEIGCRIVQTLGPDGLTRVGRSSHSIGNNFGAAVAAASVLRLKSDLVRYVLSYTAQQASGMLYWARDEEHIEKGFLFGGMPARNGVTAAIFGQLGFTGVKDSFSGENNFFVCTSPESKPELLLKGLGSQYEIMNVYIKKFPVGGPIQAALDALLILIKKHGIKASDVHSISVRVPSSRVVDNRDMPDINLQYLLATVLIEGTLTTEAAHSYERMNSSEVAEVKKRITLTDDPSLSIPGAMRQAKVEIVTFGGLRFNEHVTQVRGSPQNPMTTKEVEEKSLDLSIPVLGETRSHKLIEQIWNLEQVRNMRELRPLLTVH